VKKRERHVGRLFEGLSFVARQSRELGAQLHPELSVVEHGLLGFVAAEPDVRAADVVTAYGLDKSTVSRQIAELEAAGLLVRGDEQPGRRGRPLRLTDAGARALERAADSSRRTLAAHLADWDDDDVAALATLLERFAETSRQARRSRRAPGA